MPAGMAGFDQQRAEREEHDGEDDEREHLHTGTGQPGGRRR